ncbi:MAG TPA: hypothetical protein VFN10_06960 [Thermoanaerobaculia bacterium]|nr:hypothetical protein [Thermoanaerobaculia bacterium]
MKRLLKIALGMLSLEPLVFFAVFFFWLIPSFWGLTPTAAMTYRERFDALVPFAVASTVVLLVLALTYTALIATRSDVTVVEKVGVPITIIISNGILLPLVWWLYIWRNGSLRSTSRRVT